MHHNSVHLNRKTGIVHRLRKKLRSSVDLFDFYKFVIDAS
ncbi:hypothetical protein FHT21_005139 [Pedobacter sp. SG908]|nr:hypothetical protein [Pedobacter sp. SG908]